MEKEPRNQKTNREKYIFFSATIFPEKQNKNQNDLYVSSLSSLKLETNVGIVETLSHAYVIRLNTETATNTSGENAKKALHWQYKVK